MEIILISGKSGHGKDTLAQIMKKQLESENKKVLIIHFGDAVKWFAKDIFHWDGEKNEFGRNLLQTIGTERLRKKFPTYWAEIVAKFLAAIPLWDVVLIPDWRFKNEYETIDDYLKNTHTIRIERYINEKLYYNPALNFVQNSHISECELDKYNFEWFIYNSSNLQDLEESADYILKEILKGE